MAFEAVAALLAAEEVTATLVLDAMLSVGTTMSIVGAVTGSKDLMKLGGALAIVGGVGGFVNGAASAAGGEAVSGMDLAADGVVQTATESGMDLAADAGSADALSGMDVAADAGSNISTNAATNSLTPPSSTPMDPAADNSVFPPNGQPANAMPGSTAAPGAPTATDKMQVQSPQTPASAGAEVTKAAQGDTSLTVQGDSTNVLDRRTGIGALAKNAPNDPIGYFDKFMKFVKENKEVSNGILQLGGGLLKGTNDASIADKKFGLDQQKINQTSFGNQVASYAKPVGFVGAAQRG